VDPLYVTQTTIAVTILYKIQYRGSQKNQKNPEYWFSKYNRVLLHYSVSIAVTSVVAAAVASVVVVAEPW
jgi:hypothetical protein